MLIFVAIVVWFGRQIHDFLTPANDTVSVPSFVGQTITDANAEVERLKLTSVVIDHTTSDRYPKDVVIMQRPAAGDQVREGRQVSFVISDGIVARVMPDLRYQSMREVNVDLARTHLQLGKITYVQSDLIPEAHVISQDPAPLTSVHENDVVTLVVSKGGQSMVKVPNFVGMPIDKARALAARTGVKFGQIVWTPLGKKGPPHGVIARQVPPPNTKIVAFQPVSLQVSAGPNESGYVIRQVRVLASVPVQQGTDDNDQPLDVRLSVNDATGTYDAFHAFAQPGQKLDFTVTAVGTSTVDLFVNDSLVGEARLGNEPVRIYDQKASGSPQPSPSPGD
jgi:eukaryotic-like serine/threonine-protein kinase